jgi:hypothetical protein
VGKSNADESEAVMTDVATCLRAAADSLACARFCPSEAESAREYAHIAIPELSPDFAALVEDALSDGDWKTLDQIANAFEPPAVPMPQPKSRRQRKTSLARLVAKARQLGVDVTVEPNGAATFRCSLTASDSVPGVAMINEWDEVLPRHGKN